MDFEKLFLGYAPYVDISDKNEFQILERIVHEQRNPRWEKDLNIDLMNHHMN